MTGDRSRRQRARSILRLGGEAPPADAVSPASAEVPPTRDPLLSYPPLDGESEPWDGPSDIFAAAGYHPVAASRGWVEIAPEELPPGVEARAEALLATECKDFIYPQVFRRRDGTFTMMVTPQDDLSLAPPESTLDESICRHLGSRWEDYIAALAVEASLLRSLAREEGGTLTLTQAREAARSLIGVVST